MLTNLFSVDSDLSDNYSIINVRRQRLMILFLHVHAELRFHVQAYYKVLLSSVYFVVILIINYNISDANGKNAEKEFGFFT
jgi:hypothetical protein